MKKKFLLCWGILLYGTLLSAQVAKTRVVPVEVTTNNLPASIKLSWDYVPGVTEYLVARKAVHEWSWTPVDTLGVNDTFYTDTAVQINTVYEYYVRRLVNAVYLYGFIAAGIDVKPVHYRGEICVVVDSSLNAAIPEKLNDYYALLVGDGWKVSTLVTGSSWQVTRIKDSLETWYNGHPFRRQTVLLLGSIPVPYSGNLNPDAHPDHKGAWPADGFYGTFGGTWSDNGTYTDASRPENRNLPGDGKYDQTTLPDELKLQIGRVYLDDLPLFNMVRDSLYARYLEKERAYRMNEWDVPRRALIDDALGELGGEYPGRNGFQNGFALVGEEQTITANDTFIKILRTEPYLFSHASSTGGYTSNKQLTSGMFKTETYSVFQASFGSYHGDWDISNNLLRSEIAGPGYGLTAVWAGRPQWYFQHMSMGYPVGFSARQTQNNWINTNHKIYDHGYAGGWVHISLMGDPTLRLHMVHPARQLNAVVSSGEDEVSLTWTASSDPAVNGYFVYRSDTLHGIWNLLNKNPLTSAAFTDEHPLNGKNVYMVRPVKREEVPGGSYDNLGQGIFVSATANMGDGQIARIAEVASAIRVYPNPSTGKFFVEHGSDEPPVCRVYDLRGKQVRTIELLPGTAIDLSELPAGTYLVRIGRFTQKLTLIH